MTSCPTCGSKDRGVSLLTYNRLLGLEIAQTKRPCTDPWHDQQDVESVSEPPAAKSGLPDQRAQYPGDASRIVGAPNDVDLTLSTSQHIDREERVEAWARDFHEVYQDEAKRQGDVRHHDDYNELPENIKEFDRVLARYVVDRLDGFYTTLSGPQDVEGGEEAVTGRPDNSGGSSAPPSTTSQHIDRVREDARTLVIICCVCSDPPLVFAGDGSCGACATFKSILAALDALRYKLKYLRINYEQAVEERHKLWEENESLRQERDAFRSVICDATGTRHEKCTPEFLQGWIEDDERWNDKLESVKAERDHMREVVTFARRILSYVEERNELTPNEKAVLDRARQALQEETP